MSRLRQVSTIAHFEFFRFFKWKSELIGIAVLLLIYLAAFFGRELMDWIKSPDDKVLAVVSATMPDWQDRYVFQVRRVEQEASALAELESGEYDAVLIPGRPARIVAMDDAHWLDEFVAERSAIERVSRLTELGVSETQQQQLASLIVRQRHANARPKRDRVQKLTGLLAVIIPLMGVFSAFSYFFVSITGEKQNRLGEQLLACVDAQTWLDGKLLGLTLLAIKSMAVTLAIGGAGIFVYAKLTGLDLSLLESLSVPQLILAFAFAVLALAFWSGVLAALAATINDPNSSSRSSLMLLPAAFMGLPFFLLSAPDALGTKFCR